MLDFRWHPFSALSTQQLYELLTLRFEVFVLEQRCYYLDTDGKDFSAMHLFGKEDGELAAYARLLLPTSREPNLIFGRVAVAKSARGRGYGKLLMQEILRYCSQQYPNVAIKCSAQHYLKKFYEDFNFTACGDVYDDAGVPHIKMQRDAN